MGIIKSYRETFFEDSSWLEKLLGAIVGVLLIVVLFILLYLLFVFADRQGKQVYQDRGIVISGQFVPEYITTNLIPIGKVMIPMPINHSDAWYLQIQVKDGSPTVSVSEEFYKNINLKDSVTIEYTKGVFSSEIYPTSIGR